MGKQQMLDTNYDITYLEGQPTWETTVEKLPDGSTKASYKDRSVIHQNQSQAINNLQEELDRDWLSGKLRPEV